jgi:hypothetical protein
LFSFKQTDEEPKVVIEVVPDTKSRGIFGACTASRKIATKFNPEVDKVVVLWSGLSGWYMKIRSVKHIAEFLPSGLPPQSYKWQGKMLRKDTLSFLQMETFTVMTVGEIKPTSWTIFENAWKADDPWLPPDQSSPILFVQDNSHPCSWVALDREKRFKTMKSDWEAQMEDDNGIRGQRMTRTVRTGFEERITRERRDRKQHLVGYLGSELGEKEENIEWQAVEEWKRLGKDKQERVFTRTPEHFRLS